jgi:hypothetical protein
MLKSSLLATSFLGALIAATPALATVTTFAQVSDLSEPGDFNWSYSNGVGTFNTNNTSQGASVEFNYANIVNLNAVYPTLPSSLPSSANAYMLINGGAGIQTTAAGSFSSAFDSYAQPLNAPFTITFTLMNPIGKLSNLLTVSIAPLSGNNPNITGNGASASISVDSTTGYVETFSSDFLKFASGTEYSSVIGFNSVSPSLGLNGSNFLNNFQTNLVGTFASNPIPTVIPEPGSLAALIGGIMALGFVRRRRAV